MSCCFITFEKYRCKFHQHFISSFFAQNCFAQLLSDYTIGVCNFLAKEYQCKNASKMLVKLTTEGNKYCNTMVNFNVAVKATAIEDTAGVREPWVGSNCNSQRSLGGQMFKNGILDKGKKNCCDNLQVLTTTTRLRVF